MADRIELLLFAAGFLSWTASTLSGGGGSILLLPAAVYLLRAEAVAPVVTVASLMAGPARMLLLWRHIQWPVVRCYLPGALAGAVLGGWIFTRIAAPWLHVIVALFLISTLWQYRLGERPRSFPMRLRWFVPLSFAMALISGVVGASGLIANPFYLNYGLIKEEMIATRAANSIIIQLAKLGTYGALGVLGQGILADGLWAGAGAVLGIWLSNRWLHRLEPKRFRQFAIAVMAASGALLLWQQRGLFYPA